MTHPALRQSPNSVTSHPKALHNVKHKTAMRNGLYQALKQPVLKLDMGRFISRHENTLTLNKIETAKNRQGK